MLGKLQTIRSVCIGPAMNLYSVSNIDIELGKQLEKKVDTDNSIEFAK